MSSFHPSDVFYIGFEDYFFIGAVAAFGGSSFIKARTSL